MNFGIEPCRFQVRLAGSANGDLSTTSKLKIGDGTKAARHKAAIVEISQIPG